MNAENVIDVMDASTERHTHLLIVELFSRRLLLSYKVSDSFDPIPQVVFSYLRLKTSLHFPI